MNAMTGSNSSCKNVAILLSNALRLLIACGSLSLCSTRAQSFQNLDFEGIGASEISADGIWLAWSLAAPGWRHAVGGDSVFVYHNTPPQSHLGQYYFLADASSSAWEPLAGQFSLTLVSGHYNRNDSSSPWVNAYIEQDGLIPGDTKSFQVLAEGQFTLSINSTPVQVIDLGENRFAADISNFAGQFVNLRLSNDSRELYTPVTIDNLSFSPQVVPEPSALALFALALVARKLRRR